MGTLRRAPALDELAYLRWKARIMNVVGIGAGVKWKNGEPTGVPAVLVLVTHKVAKEQLSPADLIPTKLQDMPTDVLAVGHPVAGAPAGDVSIQTLTNKVRPASGGYSLGHFQITAGTIGTCVYDILPGGSTDPNNPVHGVGVPSKFYILSNNHVLANVNAGPIGAPILQPGPIDGGCTTVSFASHSAQAPQRVAVGGDWGE
jgi:hypothetical protein